MRRFITRLERGVLLWVIMLATAPILGFLQAPFWMMLPCMVVGVCLEWYRDHLVWVSQRPQRRADWEALMQWRAARDLMASSAAGLSTAQTDSVCALPPAQSSRRPHVAPCRPDTS